MFLFDQINESESESLYISATVITVKKNLMIIQPDGIGSAYAYKLVFYTMSVTH